MNTPTSLMIAALVLAAGTLTAERAPLPDSSNGLSVTQPTERAIFQRDKNGSAEVPVSVSTSDGLADTVEFRAINRQTNRPVNEWGIVADARTVTLPAGWYQLEFRALKASEVVATATIERVGVGEVFITCGQSNSANHGQPPQKAEDDRVSSCHFQTGLWQHGDDPQPGASGRGGSPWALLGDLLVDKHDVPVGFISVGVGSTAVSAWAPNSKHFTRLEQALRVVGPHGCRAVLWHQGESDSIAGTPPEKYAHTLSSLITASRDIAGWDVPWGVALASFHPSPQATSERQAAVVSGQRMVIATVPSVFQGPETDSYHKRGMLCDSVHFNALGLAAHAQGWANALDPLLKNAAVPPTVDTPR